MKTEDIASLLNELLTIDRPAVEGLVRYFVHCNKGLLDHPTVQVFSRDRTRLVSWLGVLNGLTAKCGEPLLVAVYDDDSSLLRFEVKK